MNIVEILQARADEHAGAPAIIESRGAVSFGDLNRMAANLADQLMGAGLREDHRVLVLCPMSIALYAVLIALWRFGAVALILDPSAGREHVNRCCRRLPPDAFVGTRKAHILRQITPSLRRIPVAFSMNGWAPGARALHLDASKGVGTRVTTVDAGTPALLTFTSGSTGEPKAAVRTHGFLRAQHRVLENELRLRPGQRDMATLPVFVLANLASGVTTIIPDGDLRRPGHIDPGPVLRQIAVARPERIAASPAFLARLVEHVPAVTGALDRFREIYTGGAPVFPSLLRQIAVAVPSADITAVYGSTEAEPIAHLRWADATAADLGAMQAGAGLLVGRPVTSIALRILPDRWGHALSPCTQEAFDRDALGAGEIGEIVVAGEHVLQGYLGGVDDSETKVHVGHRVWHRTGDAGYLDDMGRLWLMGRCAARIDDEHGRVYPLGVECAAQEVGGIRRSALVSHAGKRVLAIETTAPAEPEAFRRAVLTRLAWARLSDVVAVRRLPVDRRHNAKIDYPALRRLLLRRL